MKAEAKMKPSMDDAKLERVLVVVSPDLVKPGAPMESALVTRALALAEATGCELEFFHVCYDSSLTQNFFTDADELRRAQEKAVDQDATLLAELVVRLNAHDVSVHYDTRWDSPRTDAILRKIHQSQPDLVMKQSREYGYFMGLFSNTDWDLVRRSPAHVWFVTENGKDRIERLVSAVGSNADEQDMFAAADFDVFRLANGIAAEFGAANYPVHAYQVPKALMYSAYAPEFGGNAHLAGVPLSPDQARREIARRHGQSIEAFAEYFHINPDRVRLAEGDPSEVVPRVAKSLDADLIVMAARNLSRWERLFQSVTAEPVLADAPCDVVFVKDAEDLSVPDASQPATQGIPAYDLEKAILDPARTFGSPRHLAGATEISEALRKRILHVWEQDVRAQMAEENEGGPVQATSADLLAAINSAKASLAANGQVRVAEPAELTH